MATRGSDADGGAGGFDAGRAVLREFDTMQRIDEFLLEQLDDLAWRAAPPLGRGGRTAAAIVAHVHAVRGMWGKAAGAATAAPIDAAAATRAEAAGALGESHRALRPVVETALAGGGRVRGFKPDVVAFVAYLAAHEAHHRGQIAMLARQVGHPLPKEAGFGLWDWAKREVEA